MAKRKLHGAALAAWRKKHSKGKRRRAAKKGSPVAKKRRRRSSGGGRRRRGGSRSRRMLGNPHLRRAAIFAGGYAWGALERTAEDDKESLYYSIPGGEGRLGRANMAALILHVGARASGSLGLGQFGEILDAGATAIAGVAGYRAGKRGSILYDKTALPQSNQISGELDDGEDDDEDDDVP